MMSVKVLFIMTFLQDDSIQQPAIKTPFNTFTQFKVRWPNVVVGELGPVVKAEEYWTLNQHAADLNRGSELSWLFFFWKSKTDLS